MNEANNANKEEAVQLVDAFLEILRHRWGIKEEDIPQLLEDIRWLRSQRAGMRRLSWTIVLAVVTSAVAGLSLAIWEGIKQVLRRGLLL